MAFNPKFVSKRLRHYIIEESLSGIDDDTLASKYNLHPRTIRKYIKRCEETGTNPARPLTGYVNDIYAEFGILVHPSTIHRYFKDIGWTWKRISRIAMEVDVTEINIFWNYVSKIYTDPKQGVWLDESYRSDLTANSTQARGPEYVECVSVFVASFSFYSGKYTAEYIYE